MANILVVDDNHFYQDRLAELFRDEGHRVETAGSAEEARAIASRFSPQVLVTDRMLRGDLDGFELARALQQSLPDMRVIVITGYPSATAEWKRQEEAVFAMFEKPFDPLQLCEAVWRAAASASE